MPSAPFIDVLKTVFPVMAVKPDRPDQAAHFDFFGTAFAVAPGVFMTANHVVTSAAEHGQIAVAGPVEGQPLVGSSAADHVEHWPERDVALIFCGARDVTILDTWLVTPAQLLTDLACFGYPHAVTWGPDADRLEVLFRAYKGHVIAIRSFERLPGRPSVYEVSSAYPEGLSGAPVLWNADDRLLVVGIVLGVDTVTYGGVPQSVGIAMMANEIVGLHSQRLGGPIAKSLGLTAARYVMPSVEPEVKNPGE